MSADHVLIENRDSGRDRMEAIPMIDSRRLLGQGQRVIIRHKGEDYRLSVTRQGKLILTK